MIKFTNFSIVASFLGLWVNSFIDEQTQIIIGFILIFSFGILHGANDLQLIDKTRSTIKANSFYKIVLYYISVVVFGALLFFFIPALALSLFIMVSGYHFGEQHWQSELMGESKKINLLFHLFYGLLILSLLFVFHIQEVQRIISDISKINLTSYSIYLFFYFSLIGFLILCLIKYLKSKEIKKTVIQELLFLLVFAIIFKTSTLNTEQQKAAKQIAEITASFSSKLISDPKFMQMLKNVYMQTFTEEEVLANIQFLETPLGQSINKKSSKMMSEIMRNSIAMSAEMMQDPAIQLEMNRQIEKTLIPLFEQAKKAQ